MTKSSGTILAGESRPERRGAGTVPHSNNNSCEHCGPQPARALDPSKEGAAARIAAAPFAVAPIDETERRTRIERLKRLLEERIVFLDGAMGTMIQQHQLDERGYRGERFRAYSRDLKGNNDLLTLTQPEIVSGIHRAYLEAGADIIETNTFSANSISQADYGMEALVAELNLPRCQIARKAADEFTRTTGRPPLSWPAPRARPTGRLRCRRTSTIRAFAT